MANMNPYYPYMSYGPQSFYQPQVPQMSYSQTPNSPNQVRAMEWVEGEIGAIAYQMPPGWPANTPIPLWDNKSTTIFLKSWNQMGVPNPLQRIPYTMPEQNNLPEGNSGSTAHDMSQYVTKQDLDSLRQEIRSMTQQNQRNDQNGNGNRGGNR